MNSIPIKRQILECKCSDIGHLVIIEETQWDDEQPELRIYIQMNHYLRFHKRVWTALKYIFGTIDKQSHWSDTLITEDSAVDMYQTIGNHLTNQIQYGIKNENIN